MILKETMNSTTEMLSKTTERRIVRPKMRKSKFRMYLLVVCSPPPKFEPSLETSRWF